MATRILRSRSLVFDGKCRISSSWYSSNHITISLPLFSVGLLCKETQNQKGKKGRLGSQFANTPTCKHHRVVNTPTSTCAWEQGSNRIPRFHANSQTSSFNAKNIPWGAHENTLKGVRFGVCVVFSVDSFLWRGSFRTRWSREQHVWSHV